ncbi:MAG: NADH-quinone oxidoreductase subunit M, partial [Cyanobacteria bacterium J06648_11]
MLSVLIWLPALGALLVAIAPLNSSQARRAALWVSGLSVVWSVWLFLQFDLSDFGFQMTEKLAWLPSIGLDYELGLDGLALLMTAMNSFLTWIAIYSSSPEMERPRFFHSMMLITSSATAGAFLAQNFLLFVLLYEVELIPLYLLVSIWGGEKRTYAATKFLLYTAVSGILLLIACFGTFLLSGTSDFSYSSLIEADIPFRGQLLLSLVMLVGFGIKIPLIPLHTWLPDTYVAASTPVAIVLGGVLAKLGTYGLLRFGFSLMPDGWHAIAPILAVFATISVLYGSVVA